jgi:hypothetical protein
MLWIALAMKCRDHRADLGRPLRCGENAAVILLDDDQDLQAGSGMSGTSWGSITATKKQAPEDR